MSLIISIILFFSSINAQDKSWEVVLADDFEEYSVGKFPFSLELFSKDFSVARVTNDSYDGKRSLLFPCSEYCSIGKEIDIKKRFKLNLRLN